MSKNKTDAKKDYKIFRVSQTVEREIYLRVDKEVKSEDVLHYFDGYEKNKVLDSMNCRWVGDGDSGDCNITEEDPKVLELHPYGFVCDISLNEYGTWDGFTHRIQTK